MFGVKKFRGLICGSDTHISDPASLADYIELADAKGFNFIGSLHMRGDETKGIDGGYTVEGDVPDLEVVHPKGWGLYYGDLSTEYVWHREAENDESNQFMRDNHIEVRYARRLKLLHYVRRYT